MHSRGGIRGGLLVFNPVPRVLYKSPQVTLESLCFDSSLLVFLKRA